MRYIKTYEGYDDIMYKIGDIVICTFRKNDNYSFEGYIDQNDNFIAEDPVYGYEYKVVNIYWYNSYYSKVTRNHYFHYTIDIENIKTGKIIKNEKANYFTLKENWIKPNEPMIGDYVLCKKTGMHYKELNEFLNNNIGRNVGGYQTNDLEYIIRYSNVPKDIMYHFWNTTNPYIKDMGFITISRYDVISYSNNKEDLERILDTNKYNL
jgi:hypothetical protein